MTAAFVTALVLTATATPPPAAALSRTAELTAEVPALSAFHEVIYPLWHQAWPSKDTVMIREFLPSVEEHARALAQAALPGILRDRRLAWNDGVARLTETVSRYRAAAASGDERAMLDAVEELHARYERLVRLIRPATEELEAYHVVLYGIVHHAVPDRALGAVREASGELVDRCRALAAAPLPARFEARRGEIEEGLAALCRESASLRDACEASEWGPIEAAVGSVHRRYQSVETLFR